MLIRINDVYRQLMGPDGTLRKDVRYFDVYGGRRSGKSYDVKQILCLTAMIEPNHFIVATRKVGSTLKDSVFAEIVGFFGQNNIPIIINKSDKEVYLPNGSRFRCFGLDDPTKLKSLAGATIIWMEEASEDDEHDLDSLDAGLSPTNYPGRIILTHNPVPVIPGSPHWIQNRFLYIEHQLSVEVKNPKNDSLVLRTWYKDNAFCPEGTIKVLERYKETNPQLYKLWALGEYTRMEGLVFSNWDIIKEIPEAIRNDSIGLGLDFGYSNDPAASTRLWVAGRDLYVKQLLYKTDLHNDALYKELVDAGAQEYEKICADSARPDIIDDLYRMGLYGIVGVKKRANYKEDVATRLQSYRIHLFEGDTETIKEFSTYAWARDKNGKQLPKLQDGFDHSIDATIMRMHEYTGEVSMLDVL